MATPTSPPPSFSPRRKWSIALSVTLATLAVFAVLVGVNYLSSQYFFKRFYLSTDTQVKLSPRTVSVLKALTNNIDVTIYYDTKDNPLYSDIVSLLKEYQSHTRHLAVKTVDYYRDPGGAAEMKAKYNLGSVTNKDFIIFDNNGRTAFVDGSWLSQYTYQFNTNQEDANLSIKHKRTGFTGEMLFTAKLFAVTQPKPLKAYFLQGHGERLPGGKDEISGYTKFLSVFHRNYIDTAPLDNLLGTNTVPFDCNLLVINGPRAEFDSSELDRISQYLDQGGRLFALFDANSASHQIGLEAALAKWNVRVTHDIVRDPSRALDKDNTGSAFTITNFAPHDVTKPLMGLPLEIVMPRRIERIKAPSQTAVDEPQVTELAFSTADSLIADNPSVAPRGYSLMVAVEKGAAKGVVTERGTTRMLITGDTLFLNNQLIDTGVNQDFADSAVNWLLERPTLLAGVGPRPVTEYQLLMNKRQINAVKGILLGAIPGGILLFGGLVWLRRRR